MAKQNDFSNNIRLGMLDGQPHAEIISHQFQSDPEAAERFNHELEEAAAKLQDALRRAYAPDEYSNGKGDKK